MKKLLHEETIILTIINQELKLLNGKNCSELKN